MAIVDDTIRSPPAKRQKVPYHHKHRIYHRLPPQVEHAEPDVLPQDLLDKLLIESIIAICEEQAYKQGIDTPYIDSVALEVLRNATEEFIHKLTSKVRRSMLSARRTSSIAPDWESAFYALDLPVPDDQLQPYTVKTEINRPLLPTPPPDDEFHHSYELPPQLLGEELSKQQDRQKYSFNVKCLPRLPSTHTYRDTAVFLKRETDVKKIRELATEEGKLGEQALRKLAGAVKLEAALSTEPETKYVKDRRPRRVRRGPVLTEEAMFEETMRELLISEPGEFELGPVVSSEKQYRMPDDNKVKRRPVTRHLSPVVSNKYNLLPPPLAKSKPSADAMDIAFEL